MVAETIAAIATATGGGVGIVRISGPAAEGIVRALVPSLPRSLPSHKLVLGRVVDGDEVLDEVLVVVMRAPRSFTGEDVAELHGHGGAANLTRMLEAVLARGARLATPGEFSRRAFVAGKIDLTQAEATAAIIGAKDARSLKRAQALHRGALGKRVAAARHALVLELAQIEGALDFPDETVGEENDGRSIAAIGEAMAALAQRYKQPLGTTPEILLVGRVNVGKSSLLNALCGHERALVDASPGTTRDLVEVDLALAGGTVRLVDTAGERVADGVEARGQALARARRETAALVLFVYDGSVGWTAEDEALKDDLAGPILIVANKADLGGDGALQVSAQTKQGLDRLKAVIADKLGYQDGSEEGLVASTRQAEALARAATAIARGAALLDRNPEVTAVELRRALHHLGEITGETASEDVLDALFARFCIGK